MRERKAKIGGARAHKMNDCTFAKMKFIHNSFDDGVCTLEGALAYSIPHVMWILYNTIRKSTKVVGMSTRAAFCLPETAVAYVDR